MKKQMIFFCLFLLALPFYSTGQLKSSVESKTPQMSSKDNFNHTNLIDKNISDSDSSAIRIEPSKLSEILEKEKAEKPKFSAEELAAFANSLIPKHGVNFWVDLSGLIERRTKEKKIKELPDFFVRFDFQLTLNDATQKMFQIDTQSESCCCGYSYADFPVSRITAEKMTLIVGGKPLEIKRTKDVSFSQEYVLIDGKTKSKKIRSWQVPLETYPYGISEDGTKLYIEDDSGLLLEISEVGAVKFVPKNSPGIISKGDDLRRQPPPKTGEILYKSGENGLMLFKSKNKTYFVDFPYVCT